MADETKPIRVLHIVPDLDGGGLQAGVIRLTRELPPDAFRHVVCCLHRAGRWAERLPDSVPVHELHAGWHDVRATLRLARLMWRVRPDVVHARNWSTWPDTVLASMLTRRSGTVFSLHGWDHEQSASRSRAWACRMLARRTDHLCSVSARAAELFAQEVGLDPRRFEIIPNGVDADLFRPRFDRNMVRAELGIGERDFVVGWVGRLEPIKDIPGLLDAFSMFVRGRGATCRLVIAGDGVQRDRLRSHADRLGLRELVRWLGWRSDIARLMPAFDVFALTSRREGMNNAVLEATACGVPVVATAVGGTPEMIRDGLEGRLVKPGDPSGLARALNQLADDDDLRRRMGASACRRAQSDFSWQTTLDRYANLYRRAAAQTGQSRANVTPSVEPLTSQVAPA